MVQKKKKTFKVKTSFKPRTQAQRDKPGIGKPRTDLPAKNRAPTIEARPGTGVTTTQISKGEKEKLRTQTQQKFGGGAEEPSQLIPKSELPGEKFTKEELGTGGFGDFDTPPKPLEAPGFTEGPSFQEREDIKGRSVGIDIASMVIPIPGLRVGRLGNMAFKGLRIGGVGAKGQVFKQIPKIKANPKAQKQAAGIIEKAMSPKGLKAAKGVMAAWAGSVIIGLWGHAESPEPISIISNKFIRPEAERTGDFTLLDEADEAIEELVNITAWEKIALLTPFSAFLGIPKKIKGAFMGWQFNKKHTQDLKVKFANGETSGQMFDRIRADNLKASMALAELHKQNQEALIKLKEESSIRGSERFIAGTEERLGLEEEADIKSQERFIEGTAERLELESEFRDQQRAEEIALREEQRKLDKLDREAQATFWKEYREYVVQMENVSRPSTQIQDGNRPSTLNFGLL